MVKLPWSPWDSYYIGGMGGVLRVYEKPPVERRLKWKQTIRTIVQEKTTELMFGAKLRYKIGIAKQFCKKTFSII